MLILGAKAFAKQLIGAIDESSFEQLAFFDDINLENDLFLNRFPVFHTLEEGKEFLKSCGYKFALGTGNPKVRELLANKGLEMGGELTSVISPNADISQFSKIGNGVSILAGAIVEADAEVGEGTLVNINAAITHDCKIGSFCEVCPGVNILGNVTIGSTTFIGSGAIIYPGVTVGNNVTIGAGTVVTKDIPDNATVVGIPGRIIRSK